MWVPIKVDADADGANYSLESFEYEDSEEPRFTLCLFDPREEMAVPMLFTLGRAMRIADTMNIQEQELIDFHQKKESEQ